MKRALLSVILLSGLCLVGCASETTEDEIALDQVPAAAKAGFDKAYPGAKITEVEVETYKKTGLKHYEFEFTAADGKEGKAEFNEAGQEMHEDK